MRPLAASQHDRVSRSGKLIRYWLIGLLVARLIVMTLTLVGAFVYIGARDGITGSSPTVHTLR